jgi:hypothetical protein
MKGREEKTLAAEPTKAFKPWRLILVVLLMFGLISAAAQWYARNVTLPRHCEDPEESLRLVRHLLTVERPAADESRTPYVKAARLIFLVSRESNEDLESYLERLKLHLQRECGSK